MTFRLIGKRKTESLRTLKTNKKTTRRDWRSSDQRHIRNPKPLRVNGRLPDSFIGWPWRRENIAECAFLRINISLKNSKKLGFVLPECLIIL